MHYLYSWTLIICLATSSNQTGCELGKRMWISSTKVFHTDEDCMADWHDHIRQLSARPGWGGRVIVDAYLCGWGVPNSDPFYNLRAENISHETAHLAVSKYPAPKAPTVKPPG